MRRVSLAARRAHLFLRRPPRPWWLRPALTGVAAALALILALGVHAWLDARGLLIEARHVVQERFDRLSLALGLEVERVVVEGRLRTDPFALAEAVSAGRGAPLPTVDPEWIRARVESLHWVERARVSRQLPDTLAVHLVERRPLALWQRNQTFALVDQTGAIIPGARTEDYRHLRVIVGERAPEAAADLFALLSSEPALGARVQAATRVGDRRWSLFLDNGIEVLLPEEGQDGAIRFLATAAERSALLERAVSVIDLRHLPERLRVQLAPDLVQGAIHAGDDAA